MIKGATFSSHGPFSHKHLCCKQGNGLRRQPQGSGGTPRNVPTMGTACGCDVLGFVHPSIPQSQQWGGREFRESSSLVEGWILLQSPPRETAASAGSMRDMRASMCEGSIQTCPRREQAGTQTVAARFHRKPGWQVQPQLQAGG